MVDEARLNEFLGQFVADLGATAAAHVREAVLGNQAGEARTRQVPTRAGFTGFRRAAQTPFNLVYEARP
jgi:hypothetical protein